MGRQRAASPPTWRRRLATLVDPTVTQPTGPPPATPATEVWSAVCEQFSMRVLGATYRMAGLLEAAQTAEQTEEGLERLYLVDHATAQLRRYAETLQVLTGRRVDDAQQHPTTLLNVIRAASAPIEHYQRVQIGRVADLGIAGYAADDVIRVLTELMDNATRCSPPDSPVTVSAHLTDNGQVLVRVEDGGVGFQPGHLDAVNAMLSSSEPPSLTSADSSRLGFVVVRMLIRAHQMRVQLAARHPSGTVAMALVPAALLAEIPISAMQDEFPAPVRYASLPGAAPARAAVHDLGARRRVDPLERASGRTRSSGAALSTGPSGPGPIAGAFPAGRPANGVTGVSMAGASDGPTALPRRTAASLRPDPSTDDLFDDELAPFPARRTPSSQAWSDEIGAFDEGANLTPSERHQP
jgi:hypothetical protein